MRDRAIFVGEPDDIVAGDLRARSCPQIRPWVEAHFAFSGHITGFDAADRG